MPGGSMSGSYRSWSNRAVWVHVYPGQRALAMMLVFEEKTDDPRYGKVEKEYFFRSWVLPDMQAWAIAKTEHRYGPIDVIGPNDYKNYVPGMAR